MEACAALEATCWSPAEPLGASRSLERPQEIVKASQICARSLIAVLMAPGWQRGHGSLLGQTVMVGVPLEMCLMAVKPSAGTLARSLRGVRVCSDKVRELCRAHTGKCTREYVWAVFTLVCVVIFQLGSEQRSFTRLIVKNKLIPSKCPLRSALCSQPSIENAERTASWWNGCFVAPPTCWLGVTNLGGQQRPVLHQKGSLV